MPRFEIIHMYNIWPAGTNFWIVGVFICITDRFTKILIFYLPHDRASLPHKDQVDSYLKQINFLSAGILPILFELYLQVHADLCQNKA